MVDIGIDFAFGLNVIDSMFTKGLKDLGCDQVDCVAYNINLDYVMKLKRKYIGLRKVRLYGNTQKFYVTGDMRDEVLRLLSEGMIEVYHFSEGYQVVHSKIYRFWKDGKVVFAAIGSPNLSSNSNQNLECLVYVYDVDLIDKIWLDMEKCYTEFGIVEDTNAPSSVASIPISEAKIDSHLLDGLWKHQQEILKWMAGRNRSIVNIPPGTGKTKLAINFIAHLVGRHQGPAILVLVPTKTLIEQWIKILGSTGIRAFEWDTEIGSLSEYLANPSGKAAVTIYSRFYDNYSEFLRRIRIVRSDVIIISDECHNLYEHLSDYSDFMGQLTKMGKQVWSSGLSATLESFNSDRVTEFIRLMGGESNRYNISLPSFYSVWNDVNERPILKPVDYVPIKYSLTSGEMDEYNRRSRYVGMEARMENPFGEQGFQAAIRRAQWLRGLEGGQAALRDFLDSHIENINRSNMIIFVQTNEIAERIHQFLTRHQGWNRKSFAYIYDSSRNDQYRDYAMDRFRKNEGFCLISERMLSEGFDLPKVSSVILHGSHRSQRDWIQKIGRAIRYDQESPKAVAQIIDIVFCDPNGEPLPIEQERYQTLESISI